MDILNWVYLLKNKLVKKTVQDPEKDLVILGNNVSYVKRGDKYQSYGMTVQDFATYVNDSVAGNCPIQLNFKPGSIGEKVTFRKEANTDPVTHKDIIIPGLLEITRDIYSSESGLYNVAVENSYEPYVSPLNTTWTNQFQDSTIIGWDPLWNVSSRTYQVWSYNSTFSELIGLPSILKYDDGVNPVKYWLVVITEWGKGYPSNDYSFTYERYEILDGVQFIQPDITNTYTPKQVDVISDGVHLSGSAQGGGYLYNSLFEDYSIAIRSPINTGWNADGFTDLSNVQSRLYRTFLDAIYSVETPIVDTEFVMYDLTTDLYHKVVFDTFNETYSCDIGIGEISGYFVDSQGEVYIDGEYTSNGTGGTGSGCRADISVIEGYASIVTLYGGINYTVDDLITFTIEGSPDPIIIQVTDICIVGGFSYTRTVIPQSCGIKFADGTSINKSVRGLPSWVGTNDATKTIWNSGNGLSIYGGSGSTSFGLNALSHNTNGSSNTAFGVNALLYNTTGGQNLAIGPSALAYNTTGDANIALGYDALHDNTTGYLNTAVGLSALSHNTTGYYNTVIGYASGLMSTTGTENTAVGSYSLFENRSSGHVAVGHNALKSNTTGSLNVGLGASSLTQNTTGSNNTAVGTNALYNNTTGSNNTAIGNQTTNGNFSGSVILGASASATGSNQFVVGSSSYAAGTVTTETVASTRTWSVKINGVDRKILLA